MATETLELKTPQLADTVAVTEKDTETKKKDEVEKDEAMEEKGEEIDGEKVKSPVTPVSERPIRERKRTGRYVIDTPPRSSGNKPLSITQGRGTRLKEIPNVAYKLSKRKPDDNLFLLHTILYGKKAKAQMLKKNIGQFSGFVWSEQEEEKQRAKAKEKLDKCIKEKLIDFCDVLDIPVNKSTVKKEELAVRVLEFLVCPKATRDILLADSEKETKKRKKSTSKNVTSGESSHVPAKRRRQAKKQEQPTETEGNGESDVGSEGTNDSNGEDDVAPEEENNKSEDTETEDEKDKAKEKTKSTDKKRLSKRTKKEKPAAEEEKSIKGSAKSSRKSFRQVDKSTTSSSKKQKVDKDDSSKEKGKTQTSKPQAKGSKDQGQSRKKGKKEPTRKELHVVVTKILKEVDFNTVRLQKFENLQIIKRIQNL
jgi:protein DEK